MISFKALFKDFEADQTKTVFENSKFASDLSHITKIRQTCEKTIETQLKAYAWHMFVYMRKAQYWTDAGEDQVLLSFSAIILGKKPDLNFGFHNDLAAFEQEYTKAIQTYRLEGDSTEALKEKLDQFKFILFRKTFSPYNIELLNGFLRYLGSAYRLQGGYHGNDVEIIFGYGDSQRQGKYFINRLTQEVIRTPTTIIPMAAVIGARDIFVREETLDIIFDHKWEAFVRFLQPQFHPLKHYPIDLANTIKYGALKGYTPSVTVQDVKQCKDEFMADMSETVAYHEMGHAVFMHHLLPQKWATFAEASRHFGETCITALLEIMADIAPLHEGLYGPLYNLFKIEKSDPERAKRMFYMYFADVWFYDTPDTYMYLYSDLITMMMESLLDEEGKLDRLSFKTRFKKTGSKSLVQWSIETLITVCEELQDILLTCQVDSAGKTEVYAQCEKKLKQDIQKAMPQTLRKHLSAYEKQSYTYAKLFQHLAQNPDNQEKINQYFNKKNEEVVRQLALFLDRDYAQTPDLREGFFMTLDRKLSALEIQIN